MAGDYAVRVAQRERLRQASRQTEVRRNAIIQDKAELERRVETVNRNLSEVRDEYNRISIELLQSENSHQDDELRSEILNSATQNSILHAMRLHANALGEISCPLCGTEDKSDKDRRYILRLRDWLRQQRCPCCGTHLEQRLAPTSSQSVASEQRASEDIRRLESEISIIGAQLQTLLIEAEELQMKQRALSEMLIDAQKSFEQASSNENQFILEQGVTDRITDQETMVRTLKEAETTKESEQKQSKASFNAVKGFRLPWLITRTANRLFARECWSFAANP